MLKLNSKDIKSIRRGGDWDLIFPDTSFEKYDDEWDGDIEGWKQNGYPIIKHKTVNAIDLWEQITKATYNRAEPGVLFLDLCNLLNPIQYCEVIQASNPCGEVPNSLGVCDLGSINLTKYVVIDTTGKITFDYDSFKNDIKYCIRALDAVLDISSTPIPEYAIANKQKRRIGFGVMGLGSLHYMLGIRYGSKESLKLIHKIFKLKAEEEMLASALLGQEKGSFELFDKKKYFSSHWWKNLEIDEEIKHKIEKIGCMRNSHQSMNAPTGNTAIFAYLVSGGIEPIYLWDYTRWVIVNMNEMVELKQNGLKLCDPLHGEWFETEHFKFTMKGDEQILKGSYNGTDYEIDKNRGLVKAELIMDYGWYWVNKNISTEKIEQMKKDGVFVTTNELTVKDHIDTLKIIAQFTNQANSKTVNVPNNYPYEDFKKIYIDAWKGGIKGITTYRDGTMTAVLESKDSKDSIQMASAPKRPEILDAELYSIKVKDEKFIVGIGLYKGAPYEIFGGHMNGNGLNFTFKRKKGKIIKVKRGIYKLEIGEDIVIDNFSDVFNPVEQLTFRLVSGLLRHGTPIKYIVEQMQKATEDMTSMAAVIARVLKNYVKDGEKVTGISCPECHSENLIYEQGCNKCLNCGWSRCQ